jgi:hypothetical protein
MIVAWTFLDAGSRDVFLTVLAVDDTAWRSIGIVPSSGE